MCRFKQWTSVAQQNSNSIVLYFFDPYILNKNTWGKEDAESSGSDDLLDAFLEDLEDGVTHWHI